MASGIEALESNGQLSTDPHSMALLVEAAFETKFNTSYNPSDVSWIPPNPSVLGVPATVLGDTARSLLMDPISSEELSNAISQLDITKAEGLDNITNSMLKNTGPVGRASLLAVYVLISGLTPFTWKEGDIALILKKPPQTDVNNYRPITLISCVSKLLTKILAQRLSKAIEIDDIIGPEQNGFRSHRSCSDNTFILNSLLELNKSRKLKSYLLFVDLEEAYDRAGLEGGLSENGDGSHGLCRGPRIGRGNPFEELSSGP